MSRIFKLPPFLLPSVRLEDCDQLPHKPGVYYAIEPRNPFQPLYIGMAGNMQWRWREHHRYEQLLRRGQIRLHYRDTFTRAGAEYLEAAEIKKYVPLLNKRKERSKFRPMFWLYDRACDTSVVIVIVAAGTFGLKMRAIDASAPIQPMVTIEQQPSNHLAPQWGDRLQH